MGESEGIGCYVFMIVFFLVLFIGSGAELCGFLALASLLALQMEQSN
jgi:hypothetical protein